MIIRTFVRTAFSLSPFKGKIVFQSKPDFYDNPRILFEKMVEKGICDDNCVWIAETREGLGRIRSQGYQVVPAFKKMELFRTLLSCSDFVTSMTIPPWWKSKGQRVLFVDHGLPVGKSIGSFLQKMEIKFDHVIAPSEFFRLIYAALYSLSPERVHVTGSPREDIIFHSSPAKAREHIYELTHRNPEDYSSVILYVPTFRDYDRNFLNRMLSLLKRNFFELMEKENILFLIKPHLIGDAPSHAMNFGHSVLVDVGKMIRRGWTIYDFLRAIDLMITDYSSSWAEFLLLDEPIIFFLPDLDEYREKRGLIYEPYTEWVPGPTVMDPKILGQTAIRMLEDRRLFLKKRRWMRSLFFKFYDGRSTDRIIDLFWG